MKKHIDYCRIARQNIQKIVDGFSLEQLNTIPEGFNNSLAWNYAHVIVTQQALIYGLSGLPALVPVEVIRAYRKGTRPEEPMTEELYQNCKGWLFEGLDKTLEDYKAGKFQEFREYATSFGTTLKDLEDAFRFNNMHEAMHLGTMLAMRKLV